MECKCQKTWRDELMSQVQSNFSMGIPPVDLYDLNAHYNCSAYNIDSVEQLYMKTTLYQEIYNNFSSIKKILKPSGHDYDLSGTYCSQYNRLIVSEHLKFNDRGSIGKYTKGNIEKHEKIVFQKNHTEQKNEGTSFLLSSSSLQLTSSKQSSQLSDDSSKSPKRRRQLWIHVQEYGEGISKWRYSVPQLIAFAKVINATLVEPCMKRGRLSSCDKFESVRLSEFYDVYGYIQEMYGISRGSNNSDNDYFDDSYPLMSSHEEYAAVAAMEQKNDKIINTMSTGSNISNVTMTHYKVCFHKGNPESACEMIPNYYGRKFGTVPEINKALQDVNNDSSGIYDKGYIIIDISWYRYMGINNFIQGISGLHGDKPLTRFLPKHYQFVDEVLTRANITSSIGFQVILR